MWIWPLAYGGPSCSTYFGRPARARAICPYRSMDSQRAIAAGSATCRLAFMGKSVRGRLTEFFQSAMNLQL